MFLSPFVSGHQEYPWATGRVILFLPSALLEQGSFWKDGRFSLQ